MSSKYKKLTQQQKGFLTALIHQNMKYETIAKLFFEKFEEESLLKQYISTNILTSKISYFKFILVLLNFLNN